MNHLKNIQRASVFVLAFASTSFTSVYASNDLAQKNACFSCHSVEKKVLGPAFKAIAEKYKGQAQAESTLVKAIKSGGQGKWGAIPMPAQGHLSDADALSLAKWVLSGSPK